MKFFRNHIRYLFFLVFPTVCFLLYNSAVNIHSHQLSGSIVTHAHPSSQNPESPSPVQNHNHSEFEFFVLDQVFHFFFLIIGSIAAINVIVLAQKSSFCNIITITIRNIYYRNKSLRAPPLNI